MINETTLTPKYKYLSGDSCTPKLTRVRSNNRYYASHLFILLRPSHDATRQHLLHDWVLIDFRPQ